MCVCVSVCECVLCMYACGCMSFVCVCAEERLKMGTALLPPHATLTALVSARTTVPTAFAYLPASFLLGLVAVLDLTPSCLGRWAGGVGLLSFPLLVWLGTRGGGTNCTNCTPEMGGLGHADRKACVDALASLVGPGVSGTGEVKTGSGLGKCGVPESLGLLRLIPSPGLLSRSVGREAAPAVARSAIEMEEERDTVSASGEGRGALCENAQRHMDLSLARGPVGGLGGAGEGACLLMVRPAARTGLTILARAAAAGGGGAKDT